jgi:predicted nucleic acid-binding protein
MFAIMKSEEVLLKTSLRKPNTNSLEDLDDLQDLITFLPLITEVIKEAAGIWAKARIQGMPT